MVEIKEVVSITLVCFIAAFVITMMTGCAGAEIRIGFAGYNQNAESRSFVEDGTRVESKQGY
jgi:hypothetical protein